MDATERYRVFDSFGEGVQVVDGQWRYRYLNPAAIRHSQSTLEALIGRTMMECYPGIEQTRVFGEIERCFSAGQEGRTVNEFAYPDGSTAYFELRIIPIEEGVLILSSDVTEQHAHRLLLEGLRDKLEAVVAERTAAPRARMLELDQMASIIGHDLRAPLRAINGMLGLLQRRVAPKLEPSELELLERAIDGGKRLGSLLGTLLSHAAIGRERKVAMVDLDAQLAIVLSDLEPTITETQGLVRAAKLPMVWGCPEELQLLMQNLISNALKYAKPGVPPRVDITAEPCQDGWRVSVRDNGIGMEQQSTKYIFEMFYRLRDSNDLPGSGVGLAHCKKIVDLHEGKIWVDSELGQGSTFHFVLPAKPSDAAQLDTGAARPAGAPRPESGATRIGQEAQNM